MSMARFPTKIISGLSRFKALRFKGIDFALWGPEG